MYARQRCGRDHPSSCDLDPDREQCRPGFGERQLVKEPVYDVKVLYKLVTGVAREIRLLDQALKATNAKTVVDRYDQDDAVLGELS